MTINISLNQLANLQNENTAISTINANSETIEGGFSTALNVTGDQMQGTLDMNSNNIINLPNPVSANSPLRLQDLNTFIGGGTINTIPAGGSTNQVLAKKSNTNYDVQWDSVSSELVAGTNIVITGTSPATINTSTSPSFQTVTATSAYIGPTGGIGGGIFIAHTAANENLSVQAHVNATSGIALTSIADNNSTLEALELNSSQVYLSTTTPLVALGGITTNTISGTSIVLSGTMQATSFTGAVPVASLNSGSNANSTTFFRGDNTWNAPAASAYTNLGSISGASLASSSIFTTGAYSAYEIIFSNLIPSATGASLQLLVYSSGTTSVTSYQNTAIGYAGGTISGTVQTTNHPITTTSLGNNAQPGASGSIRFFAPSSASSYKHTVWKSIQFANSQPVVCEGGGWWSGATTALQGFSLGFSGTTTIASGTCIVYGII